MKAFKLWKNTDLMEGTKITAYAFDTTGNLYLCGYYYSESPGFIAIDFKGNTLGEIDSFGDGAYGVSSIDLSQGEIVIILEDYSNGDTISVYINMEDYSYISEVVDADS